MYPLIKYVFDFLLTCCLLIILAPVVFITGLLVRLEMGSPIIFKQERAGRHGRPFCIFKFRTMTESRDPSGNLLADKSRLTPLGLFLRKSSLDELPQLINVLKGEISLVGPRPLHVKYIPRYTEDQKRRLLVLPGITGLAQVNGRNAITWEEKFKWDVLYVETASFSLDLKILGKTIYEVLCRSNISQEGHATASEFMGTASKGNRYA